MQLPLSRDKLDTATQELLNMKDTDKHVKKFVEYLQEASKRKDRELPQQLCPNS